MKQEGINVANVKREKRRLLNSAISVAQNVSLIVGFAVLSDLYFQFDDWDVAVGVYATFNNTVASNKFREYLKVCPF